MERFEEYLLKQWYDDFDEGLHKIYKFPNKYGASVIKTRFSYGGDQNLWGLAVLIFGYKSDDYSITYDTPITHDVLGYLTDEEVANTLEQIKNL